MNIHITNLHNLGGTATLAQNDVVRVARELGYREMPIERRSFYEDYWNMISHHQDGAIASLYFDDVVIFQYPSWNGTDYDKTFVQKLKAYAGVKLIVFVHDFQQMMFNSEPHIMRVEVEILNQADVLIFPTEKMYQHLLQNGLNPSIPVFFQKIWEMPGYAEYTGHENLKRICFTGNFTRFPFLQEYYGKTVLEYYDGEQPKRKDDACFRYMGYRTPMELLEELAKGGFGLVWCDKTYFEQYYSMNQPHKLGFCLAAGIPVIARRGCAHEKFIEENHLGYIVDSLEEMDVLVQQTDEETYQWMIKQVHKIQRISLKGLYTKKLLIDAVIKAMEK